MSDHQQEEHCSLEEARVEYERTLQDARNFQCELDDFRRHQTEWSGTLMGLMKEEAEQSNVAREFSKTVAVNEAELEANPAYNAFLDRRNIGGLKARDPSGGLAPGQEDINRWFDVEELVELTPYCAQIPIPKRITEHTWSTVAETAMNVVPCATTPLQVYLNGELLGEVPDGVRSLEKFLSESKAIVDWLEESILVAIPRCLFLRETPSQDEAACPPLRLLGFVFKGNLVAFECSDVNVELLAEERDSLLAAATGFVQQLVFQNNKFPTSTYLIDLEVHGWQKTQKGCENVGNDDDGPGLYLIQFSSLESRDYTFFTWDDLYGMVNAPRSRGGQPRDPVLRCTVAKERAPSASKAASSEQKPMQRGGSWGVAAGVAAGAALVAGAVAVTRKK
eukprot:PhM_4_TR6769/c0_g1_i1/m.76447